MAQVPVGVDLGRCDCGTSRDASKGAFADDRQNSDVSKKPNCKLPDGVPFFALDDFTFEMYAPEDCPLCKEGKSEAIKPGSRGN